MIKKIILLLAVIVFVGVLFLSWQKFFTNEEIEPTPLTAPTLQDYEVDLAPIIGNYISGMAAVSADDYAAVTDEALTKLLTVRVPAQAKDKHLNIVLALTQIKQGLQLDEPQTVAAGIAKFNEHSGQILILATP